MTIEQKVVTVENDDTAMNDEITTQSVDGWVLFSLTLSDVNVILLFNKTTIPT